MRRLPSRVLSLVVVATLGAADLPVIIGRGAPPAPDGAVSLRVPPAATQDLELVGEDGQRFRVARCGDGLGRVLLPGLTGVRRFTLRSGAQGDAAALIAVQPNPDEQQSLVVAGKEIATWQGGRGVLEAGHDEKLRRGGYIA